MKMEFKTSLLTIITSTLFACGGSSGPNNDQSSEITITSGEFHIQNLNSLSTNLDDIQLLPTNNLYISITSEVREKKQN